jgi:CHAT domain-containing protein
VERYLQLIWKLLFASFLAVLPLGSEAATTAPATGEARDILKNGWAAFEKGSFEQAIPLWQSAATKFRDAGEPKEEIKVLVYLAHVYQLIGQYESARRSLAAATILIEKSDDLDQRALVSEAVGSFYLASGRWDDASKHLGDALQIARETKNRRLSASIQNNLGNLAMVQKKYNEGVAAYVDSANSARETKHFLLAARALINASMALTQAGEYRKAEERLSAATDLLGQLTPSHDNVYTTINAALVYETLSRHLAQDRSRLLIRAGQLLNDALATAGTIGDRRGQSYALGYLGMLYESERRHDEALDLTRRAVASAHQVNAPEALWRWEWQTGRLLKSQDKMDDSIAAYRRAIGTLQVIRQELSAAFVTQRLSFRESVGPVYFELVDLLLRHPDVVSISEKSQDYLKEARGTVEIFKAAELRDYFRDDCVDAALARKTNIDVVTPKAMVIHPIVLPDRLELLISQAGRLKKTTVPVSAELLTREVREFRQKLEKRTTNEYLPHAQMLYDWIIRPIEADLDSSPVDTLVFVPDGALRTIPMAALHDGKKFLIAKYPIAITPGMDMTDPKPLRREKVNVLALGLTEAVQGYPELPYVAEELQSIQRIYGNTPLINQDYLVPRVEKTLRENQFNVVHVASHGEFSSDIEKTFLLTFDDKLTMDRLDQYVGLFRYRDDPLELLTLSACVTAAGDDRAALGLAGIAVKAGARSALATLWYISDAATPMLIDEFYRQLKDSAVSRAAALQRAQLKLLDAPAYEHPGWWSPFLLINNWL